MQMPLILEPGTWKYTPPPANLDKCPVLGLDTESFDPNLLTKGPGSIRKDGFIVGFSIANEERGYYVPIKHAGSQNITVAQAKKMFASFFKTPKIFTGANLHAYDLEWLISDGYITAEQMRRHRFEDTQLLEPLLDEERDDGYSLDVLGKSYLGLGKVDVSKDMKRQMHLYPASAVGAYAERDAHMCVEIRKRQLERINEESLNEILDLEVGLVPLLVEMRLRGVPVDVEGTVRESERLVLEEKELHRRMRALTGFDVDEWSADSVAKIFSKLGITVPRTVLNNVSITADFMEDYENEEVQIVRKLRKVNRLRNFFLDEYILANQVNGRIHSQFHQLRKDDLGTRSGRFSSSGPNLQQAPKRDDELAPLVRGKFVADRGTRWGQWDYSQQEPRTLVHYAVIRCLTDANKIRDFYRSGRDADFYKYIMAVAQIERFDSKTTTLGRMYGMGKKKLAMMLNKTLEEATVILKKFDDHAPFVQELARDCQNVVRRRGYIRTFCGRRRRFNTWAPVGQWTAEPVSPARAKVKYADQPLERFGTHKALNGLIQGSCGDMIKKAMLQIYREMNYYIPYVTVHDEIDGPVESDAQAKQIQDIMESCVQLEVPLVANPDIKENWA